MNLNPLLSTLQVMKPLSEVNRRLDNGDHVILGVPDAGKAVTAALLWQRQHRPTLLIAARETDAEAYSEQLAAWCDGAAMHFPAHGTLPYQREAPDIDVTTERLRVLAKIANPTLPPPLIIASANAIGSHTLAPADLSRGIGTITIGEQITIDALAKKLIAASYEFGPLVEIPSQASRRGGLLDIFPPTLSWPIRIEFFGNKIESIRTFDPDTQRTIEQLNQISISLASEWYAAPRDLIHLATRLSNVKSENAETEMTALRQGQLPTPARYGPLLSEATILDHLRDDALFVIDEREQIEAAASDQDDLASERRTDLADQNDLASNTPFPHSPREDIVTAISNHSKRVDLDRWATGRESSSFRLPFSTAAAYAGRLASTASDQARQLARGDRVIVVTQQAQRYAEILTNNGLPTTVHTNLENPLHRGTLSLLQGTLSEGWTLETPDGSISLTTDRELFGFQKQRRKLRKRATHRSQFLSEIQPGDFVVHADHGIARFSGIVRRPIGNDNRDYLELRYADNDRIYVPVEQVDKVSRYSGPSGHAPRLTRLGTQEWKRARSRVKTAVSIVAADLVRLYAARQMLQGHAFSADTTWQQELEASFPYEETSDQLEAIIAVKTDMQSEHPMDRVICGDVGFGKTEVAIRAAFKAVQDDYQVAVLVPTTVLAQQHLKTFRERFASFPVSIDSLSRFRTGSEAANVIGKTRHGKIDILIGTHRMLAPSIEFQNLGLVIIDEEQRFGVTHKERLKRMRLEVDVLTLSATPIPRTMHMALSGIRDMSTIDTAPENRQAVQTYVTEWDTSIVRESLLHEIERGGQVYIVHNRTRSIDDFAERIHALVPEARVAVGHGQMSPTALKNVMTKFANGEFDVLVCTTIIESGIDIPNVNTLIVDRADRLGLAQMYQLRGRVGRGTNQAYAYLTHPKDKVMSEIAQQRLSTIFEANELGAGFQIALRDLEIRGAGNLLGAEQSGSIATVGFDLYTQMLAEAVEELKSSHEHREPESLPHQKQQRLRQVVVDLPVAAFIPETYVEEIDGRLALYHRISGITNRDETRTLEVETRDRFGEIPEPLAKLLQLVRIRIAASNAHIDSVRVSGNKLIITSTRLPFSSRTLPGLPIDIERGATQLRRNRTTFGNEWLDELETLLLQLAKEIS